MADPIDLSNVVTSIIAKNGSSLIITKQDSGFMLYQNREIKHEGMSFHGALSYIAEFLHEEVYPCMKAS